jgi:hypothetical protein
MTPFAQTAAYAVITLLHGIAETEPRGTKRRALWDAAEKATREAFVAGRGTLLEDTDNDITQKRTEMGA